MYCVCVYQGTRNLDTYLAAVYVQRSEYVSIAQTDDKASVAILVFVASNY